MMENEVIIDGVNVAGCEFLGNKEDECLIRGYGKKHIMMFNCKHNPNCYFKQLQRAKVRKKYIIKNCPAYDYDAEFNYHVCKQSLVPYEGGVDDCRKCTDCVMKQIVKLCNDVLEQETDPLNSLAISFAQKILQLLEIEETDD